MKALLFSNEFPPNIYGGAGVHVEYLSRELSKLMEVEVRCFGNQVFSSGKLSAKGFPANLERFKNVPKELQGVFSTLDRCLGFAGTAGVADKQVVHCHTWYTHMAGIWTKLNYGIPLVLTTHSLEPLRPWKREQLGRGYDFSLWVEDTAIKMADAVIAVSKETKADVLKHFSVPENKISVIYNGIDADEFKKVPDRDALTKHGVGEMPYILFVGRITRQKGIMHLVRAIKYLSPDIQVVLCAGAPDTPEIAEEMRNGVSEVSKNRKNVVWIQEMVDKKTLIQLYSHATAFCCPSIYEPFGIINLEAMACEVPVIASAVGGIKEVVVHDRTGYLVPLEQMDSTPFEAINPDMFSRDLAEKINVVFANPERAKEMGKAGRKRTENVFSWKAIAKQTYELYSSLVERV